MSNENKRQHLLIDHQVQSALIRRYVLHWLIFIVVTFLIIGFLQSCISAPANRVSVIIATFFANNSLAIVVSASLLPIFVYDVVKLTNRFAGPISRLRKELKSLANGEPAEPLSFRDNDFWDEIATDFNRAFELQSKTASNEQQASTVLPDARELQTTMKPSNG